MKVEIAKKDISILVKLKRDSGLSHSQIANRYNKAYSLKGSSRLRPKDVKEILKGIPSKRQQNDNQQRVDFGKFFDDL